MHAGKKGMRVFGGKLFFDPVVTERSLLPGSRSLLTAVICVVLLGACRKSSPSNNNIPPETPVPEPIEYTLKGETRDINRNCGGFYEALPSSYHKSADAFPLLLFLHGGGERGNGASDLPLLLKNSVPRLLAQEKFPVSIKVGGREYSFIVIAPQFKDWPGPEDVRSVMKYALSHYRVDSSRIYVAGLSMGGGATWEYAARYGSSLAAIVPICGASWADSAIARKIASTNVPAWAFHNQDDSVVPVDFTIKYVNLINFYKPDPLVRLTIWPSGQHDAWTRASDPGYKEEGKNIYEWMLGFTRQ
ncbi:MAG TPA: dienelactone hydrolase family protein [Flavitalea sp.]|nr:dienelactone hydrolase family protein [Flavitalea sp.]